MRRFSGDEFFSTNDLQVIDQIVGKYNGKAGHRSEYNPRRIEAR
jgi:hypothetical protein